MIILVTEKNEKPFGQYTNLEVKGINQKTYKETTQDIYSTLQEKWGFVKEGELIELVMQNKGTPEKPKWQVVDIKPATEADVARLKTNAPSTKPSGGKPQVKRAEAFAPSPEKIESIEGQKAADLVNQAWIAGKIKDNDFRLQLLNEWEVSRLSASLGWELKEVKTVEVKQPEPDKTISVGDMKTVIYQNNWKERDALDYAKKKWHIETPKDLTQSQRKELIAYIKANPK